MPVQIDPNTGERMQSDSSAQFDPQTGERISSSTDINSVPGSIPGQAQPKAKIPHPELNTVFSPLNSIGPQGAYNYAKGAIQSTGNMIAHPIDAAKSIMQPIADLSPSYTSIHGMPVPIPNVKGFQNQKDQLSQLGEGLKSNTAETLGNITGPALITGAAMKVPGMINGIGKSALRAAYPQSAMTTAPEAGANALARALNLPANNVENFRQSAIPEAPNVIDYAKRNNLPIRGTADLAKVGRAAGDEVNNWYKENVLNPSAKEHVSVRGISEIGRGEGQNATLAEINSRVSQLNQVLDRAYRQQLAGNPSPLAAKEEMGLKTERDGLAKLLTSELSKRTGMTPQQITDVRQRFGRLYNISDTASETHAGDISAEGKNLRGSDIPGSKSGVVGKLLQKARGGPEVIGNRAVINALSKVSGQPTPLPSINPPVVQGTLARPLMRGLESGTTQATGDISLMPPDQELQQRGARLDQRKAAVEAANAVKKKNLASHGGMRGLESGK